VWLVFEMYSRFTPSLLHLCRAMGACCGVELYIDVVLRAKIIVGRSRDSS